MDDIIDLEIESIDKILRKIESDKEPDIVKKVEIELWHKIRKNAVNGRRAGIGITAEADMIAALNLQYGTESQLKFSNHVHKLLALNVYSESVTLASERGAFPVFDVKKELNNPFLNRLYAEEQDLFDRTLKFGRRNIALLTIAPTGTTSLMSQTSSGIEPVFKPYYVRKRKIRGNNNNDTWESHIVVHHNFAKWYAINFGVTDNEAKTILSSMGIDKLDEHVKISPYKNSTADTIDWNLRVKLQSTIQRWIDHSISSTVNLSENTQISAIYDIYTEAWRSGCKGITVYREGSREGVLVDASKLNKEYVKPKRPAMLSADIVHFNNNEEQWVAVIGTIDGRPYELFTGKYQSSLLPKSVKTGEIHKFRNNGHSEYVLKYVNGHGPAEITISEQFDPQYWNYAKLISGVLRNGMPIQDVVNLVSGLHLSDHINTWKVGVKRALKRYIVDGTVATGVTCESCGSDNIVYQEGCEVCMSCGNGKCG